MGKANLIRAIVDEVEVDAVVEEEIVELVQAIEVRNIIIKICIFNAGIDKIEGMR
ncbi:unnamed protein product [Meloidogyne enterolobii]|uniref:Uncharacterized protein n=2 Tax=Meloidogyne enterolobii TaxID=390850 RepID=A0A6V7XWP3_MELEN|nr:unnamed protein product [Meloidogyne enterolobii]